MVSAMSDTDRARDILRQTARDIIKSVDRWIMVGGDDEVREAIEAALSSARAEGFAAGEQAERAAIVKWLRKELYPASPNKIADAIERADHLPKDRPTDIRTRLERDKPKPDLCKWCRGTGMVADYVGLEMTPVGVECDHCNGTGHVRSLAEWGEVA